MGYNHKEKGYPFHWNFEGSPVETIDKKNKTPRTFPIQCNVTGCIWWQKEHYEREGFDFGTCSRFEAFNVLEVEELEVNDKSECGWYSGRMKKFSLYSVEPTLFEPKRPRSV